MSFLLKYYRLFEVRLLHEYYLLGPEALTYFDKSAADRMQILQRRILNNHYRLNEDIDIQPTEACQQQLDNYRLKFGRTSTGFVVVAEGKSVSGQIEPVHRLDAALRLQFSINVKNPLFKNYSGLPLQSFTPANYYFTNKAGAQKEPGNFISLSQAVPGIQPGQTYGIGELAFDGSQIVEATYDTAGTLSWSAAPHAKGCVSSNDRVLLPKVFTYTFDDPAPLQVEMTLRQLDNTVIKRLEFTSTRPLSFVRGNFSTVSTATNLVQAIPDGWYKLEVNAAGATQEQQIYLSDHYRNQAIGLIDLSFDEIDVDYRILSNSGAIQQPAPNFEIRFLSRRTFWRYMPKYQGMQLVPESPIAPFFQSDGNDLITSIPQKLSLLPSVQDTIGEIGKLPQPTPNSLRTKIDLATQRADVKTMYSEIRVAKVKDKINLV